MSNTFTRGSIEDYICSFLTLENKEPTTIVDPKITIRHIDDAFVVQTDINEAAMTLMAENTYYFRWNIPVTAYVGTYNVECQAIVDGEYTERNETILVLA
jgi:hypothetical protein